MEASTSPSSSYTDGFAKRLLICILLVVLLSSLGIFKYTVTVGPAKPAPTRYSPYCPSGRAYVDNSCAP